jgi:urocanate hydratase
VEAIKKALRSITLRKETLGMGSGKPLGLWKAIKEALRTIRTPKKPCIWAVEAINKALRTITWRKETLHMGS